MNLQKKSIFFALLATGIIITCIGCSHVQNNTQDFIIETLSEKYPEKTFVVEGQDGLYYNVTDGDGIKFQAEPIQTTRSQFWCTDNYLDAYFQENGTVDRCNEILERYNVENRVEIGEPFELNLGMIDDEENCAQMAECLDKLAEVLKVPFEVSYFDKGTPQQAEKYQGSSTVGTFSYISLDYAFHQPHIKAFVGEGTISIKDIQETLDGQKLLEDINVQVNEYDLIGEALEPDFYAQLTKVVEEGSRPVEVYGDDYRHFDISIEMIHAKITGSTDSAILTVKNDGKDETGNTILRVTAENGDELILHLGMNEGVAYSYKLEDLYMTD